MTAPDPHHHQVHEEVLCPETLCDSVQQTTETDSFQTLVAARTPLDLQTLITVSNSRNCMDALHFIKSCRDRLEATHHIWDIPFGSRDGIHQRIDVAEPTQFGDLLYIPRTQGRAYIVSDVEGNMNLIQGIFQSERILERLEKRDPHDQVFFLCLGDVVDRAGYQASQIVEFLLDLKYNRGFFHNIHLVAGNHELSPLIQMDPYQGGFFNEVINYRSSYASPGRRDFGLEQEVGRWFNDTFDIELPADLAPYRVALWREFNDLFGVCPKTIITENGLVLCHAGLTDSGPFQYLSKPEEWKKPSFAEGVRWLSNTGYGPNAFTPEEEEAFSVLRRVLVEDVTWSDWQPEVSTTQPNITRQHDEAGNPIPLGRYFGPEALSEYLEILGAKLMIRGHQKNPLIGARRPCDGVWHSHDKIMTINSSAPSSSWFEEDDGVLQEEIRPANCYLEVELNGTIRGVESVKVHTLRAR